MSPDYRLTPTPRSRIADVDFDNLGFGNVFSDHIFCMSWRDGHWTDPQIKSYGPITLEPGALSLHYGQAVFEGLKAFNGVDGKIRIFRPDKNAERLRQSCERLCIPPLDDELFCDAIEALVDIDRRWIPRQPGQSLYIRPLIYASESHLEVRPATELQFVIMTAPVREYFQRDAGTVSLRVEDTYTRSAPGGVGFAKTAGNYAASLRPGQEAREEGMDQVLWLDGAEHRYVEEVGQMNIFFRFDDRVLTPALRGTILPGVTRDSVITLLRDQQIRVEERRIEISEIIDAIRKGTLQECFGSGTAAVISPVGKLRYGGKTWQIRDGEMGDMSRRLYDTILGIQNGTVADKFSWNRIVAVSTNATAVSG